MGNDLHKWFPAEAIGKVEKLFSLADFSFRVTKKRTSKLGDFRVIGNKTFISVNGDLSKHQFLITFVHEFAHWAVYKKYKNRVKPHGIEWKRAFAYYLMPFVEAGIFPEAIEEPLRDYLKSQTHYKGRL